MTSRYDDKICPFFRDKCKQEQCGIFEARLDNCGINLITYNLFKLDRSMIRSMEGSTPEAMLQNQPVQGSYPAPQSQYRPG